MKGSSCQAAHARCAGAGAAKGQHYATASWQGIPFHGTRDLLLGLSAGQDSMWATNSSTTRTDTFPVPGCRSGVCRVSGTARRLIATTTSATHNLTGLTPSTTSSYSVQATDLAGNTHTHGDADHIPDHRLRRGRHHHHVGLRVHREPASGQHGSHGLGRLDRGVRPDTSPSKSSIC